MPSRSPRQSTRRRRPPPPRPPAPVERNESSASEPAAEAQDELRTIGLSSASSFYAEDDLFTIGQQEDFTNADAIFQLPEGWDISNWRIVCNETGEEWIVQVPVV